MSPPAGAARPGREIASAVVFFLAATVLMTWPQAAHLSDALSDVGDAKLNARILQWDFRQTLRDPANLYELNFFHPAHDVLAFSENLWGVSLFGFPLLAAGSSALTNYNVLLLLGMFFSAVSAWALARYVTGDALASVVAGLVYAFVPWRFSQIPHLQFQWGGFLCLLMLFLLRYLDHGRRSDAIAFGVTFAWNALCNVHYALFSGFLVVVTLALFAVGRGPGSARRLRGAVLAVALASLAVLPFLLPYRRVERVYGMRRHFGEVMTYSGRWTDFLSAGDRNRLYGPSTVPWRGAEGDFFPGLLAVALAVFALLRLRRRARRDEEPAAPVSPGRRRAARALDVLAVLLFAAWVASRGRDGLRVGPLGLGDPGRIAVVFTAVVAARLAVAFPRRARSASLGAFLRGSSLDPRALLFAVVGGLGILVALGGHTPYYRFLYQSFGGVFRSIRAPARGIVLLHVALAVLAAWGLSLALRGSSLRRRLAWSAAAVAALVVEYRAFPLALEPTRAEAPPVYRWLATLDLPCAVVEWPLGFTYDFDYVFRQGAHEKALVNGYSGFFPVAYRDLEAALKRRPIPDSVWAQMGELGAGLLVYHAHEGRGFKAIGYAEALDRQLAAGSLELLREFPHDEGIDFVFLAAGTPWRDRVASGAGDPSRARRDFEDAVAGLRAEVARLAPPFGSLDAPSEEQTVTPGLLCFGWAIDDSGIAAILVETELGPAAPAVVAVLRPGLGALFPDYGDAEHGGFSFPFPDVPPGRHRLTVTFVGKDGGRTAIERWIRVAPAARPPAGTPTHGR